MHVRTIFSAGVDRELKESSYEGTYVHMAPQGDKETYIHTNQADDGGLYICTNQADEGMQQQDAHQVGQASEGGGITAS